MYSSLPRRTLVCLPLYTLLLFAGCNNTGNSTKVETKLDTKLKIGVLEVTTSDAAAREKELNKEKEEINKAREEINQQKLALEAEKRKNAEEKNERLQEEINRLKQSHSGTPPQSVRPDRKYTSPAPAQPRPQCQTPCVMGSYIRGAGTTSAPAVYRADGGQPPKTQFSGTPQNQISGQLADIQQSVHQVNGRVETGFRDMGNAITEVQGNVTQLRNQVQSLSNDVWQLNRKTGVHKLIPQQGSNKMWCLTHQQLEKP
ncbi:MAG TPA: hypothetical protein VFD58_08320 [Blastocatellia bacterium]|nr:hypothetical protein [Blastocatellia bacterium]